MGMIDEIGNEMNIGKFLSKRLLDLFGPLAVDEFKKIETNSHAIDANQTCHVLDVINVPIQRGLGTIRTDDRCIDSDYSATLTDHLDLVITDVAFDVVIAACVGV